MWLIFALIFVVFWGVAAILTFIFLGERINSLQFFSINIISIGIILLALDSCIIEIP